MRLVLDTSVVVAAVRSDTGASHRLLQGVFQARFDLVISASLFLEYESVLKREEHLKCATLTVRDIDRLIEQISDVAYKIELGYYRRPTVIDAGDEHVLNLAWRARAHALVTHNLRHFQPGAATLGVHCCLPADAVRLLEI